MCLTGGIINIISITTIIRIIIITTIIITSTATIIAIVRSIVIVVPKSVLQEVINKTLQGGKRLLFNSDPWPPAEQKLEMPCDIYQPIELSVEVSCWLLVITFTNNSLTSQFHLFYL